MDVVTNFNLCCYTLRSSVAAAAKADNASSQTFGETGKQGGPRTKTRVGVTVAVVSVTAAAAIADIFEL